MAQLYEPLDLAWREDYRRLWERSSQSSSDQSFLVLWGWRDHFGYQAAWDDDLVWLRQERPIPLHLPPVGAWEDQDWEKRLIDQVGRRARFVTVPEHLALDWVDQLGPMIAIEEDRNSFEYLYRAADLVSLAGNRHMRRRNKINQFRRHYASSRFVPLDEGLIEPIRALQRRWLAEQVMEEGSSTDVLLRAEDLCIGEALAHWREFGLFGGAIDVDGELIAYTLAEPVPDGTLQIHFEKGLEAFPGAYQAINHDFLVWLDGRWDVVNREEDMGDPGLRHAKLAYSPTMFLRKYTVLWDADATALHPLAFPKRPAQIAVSDEPTGELPAARAEPSTEQRPVTREEVFGRSCDSGVALSFEARKRCKIWQSVEAELDRWIDAQSDEALRISDDLADHPELSGQEFRSSSIFADLLVHHGFAVERSFLEMPTAFMARKTLGHGGPVVAFLVEYDALPDVGHGCGHNLHGTVSAFAGMGLAHALERHRLDATVWVVGTPSEETDGGKILMANSGAFDDVTLALMFHCTSVKARVAARFLALDGWRFAFEGRPSHASASPWKGRSAQNGLRLFLDALDMLRLHMMPTDRLNSVIEPSSSAVNIIAPKASCLVEARSVTRSRLNDLDNDIFNAARGAALATGTTVGWAKFMPSFDDMQPNPAAEELAARVLVDMGMDIAPDEGATGSSDVGNLSYRCPCIHPSLPICSDEVTAHTRAFAEATRSTEGHKALLQGVRALARIGGRVAVDVDLARLIRQDFEASQKRNGPSRG